ncbi:hypothetical protein BZA77DRAFT_365910 [Pyronema omphalodes]|nr:hypothetical protein BZA77DRAFT_365910 [Pyronema omphalodes]
MYKTDLICGAGLFRNSVGEEDMFPFDPEIPLRLDSAVLLDTLVSAGVSASKLDVQWFTDSDHSINFHQATRFLYKQITGKLFEEKNRKNAGTGGGHQWSKRALGKEMNRRRVVAWVA